MHFSPQRSDLIAADTPGFGIGVARGVAMKEPQEWLVEAKWIVVLLIATCVTAGVGFWQRTREHTAIEGLRQEERRIVYEHAIAPLRSLCANQSRSTFDEYCRQQAEFLLLFPECDDACRKLAEEWLPRPTR